MLNNKGVSLISLIITMIVIIILATISVVASRDSVENAKKLAFLTGLTELQRGLDSYNQRAFYRGVATYDSEDLFWSGNLNDSPRNTAKIKVEVDKNSNELDEKKDEEDTLYTIFGKDIPNDVKDKIYIYEGNIFIFYGEKETEHEYKWIMDNPNFSYMVGNCLTRDKVREIARNEGVIAAPMD